MQLIKYPKRNNILVFNRHNSSSSYVAVADRIIANSQRRLCNGNVTLDLWKVASLPESKHSLFFLLNWAIGTDTELAESSVPFSRYFCENNFVIFSVYAEANFSPI